MANKYIKQVAGVLTEQEATIASAGVGDAGKIVALDNTGKLALTLLPTGIGADTATIPASENLASGDLVNIWSDSGFAKARKADAATSKEAHGFVLASYSSGQDATVYFEGTNTQVTGQIAGVAYLSATTPGIATSSPPSAATNIIQRVGVVTGSTTLNFESGVKVVLA